MARTVRRDGKTTRAVAVPAFEPLLDDKQIAEIFNVAPQSVSNQRCTGRGPFARLEWIKLGTGKSAPIRATPASVRRLIEELSRAAEPAA